MREASPSAATRATPLTYANETTAASAPHFMLRIGLFLVAFVEFADALSSVHNIFTDYHHATALLRFAQALTSVKLALAPLVAGSAAVLAVMGRTRYAIGALAALQVLEWILQDIWSIPFHGLELSLNFGGVEAFCHHFVFPAVAIAGAMLAFKNRRLALAGLLVSLPTLINWTGVIVFTIGIMIYGF
jgi:hypothetical protein